jgi:hypothetical protein
VVHHGEQMHLAAVVASGAAEGLAVDCDRTPPLAGIVTVDQPRADDGGYRVRLQTGEGPPDRGSVGTRRCPVRGSCQVPRAARTAWSVSAAHSAIAANDLAPVSPAAAARAMIATRG